jgi:hypothetical protein
MMNYVDTSGKPVSMVFAHLRMFAQTINYQLEYRKLSLQNLRIYTIF